MLKNVGTVLDNNPELTMACINLAMHSAITTDKPTSLTRSRPNRNSSATAA